MASPIFFHIDVNSAFLSWEALRRLQLGEDLDLRTIPSAIGGDESKRHGIVLAKSTPAKAYGIVTGEPLAQARRKCPNLTIVPPNFSFFVECSKSFIALLNKYAPVVEQFSIDEAFCDMTGTEGLYGDLVEFAHKLKDEIRTELGFTVNIGVSSNHLLAKMASDFQKPDRVHTLFPDEIPQKLWPLPVDDLFFVGRSSAKKLHMLGIHTIGELAKTDPGVLQYHFKKHGEIIHGYANGKDLNFNVNHDADSKSFGNSITLSEDVTDFETARLILLTLSETVGARIRADKSYISVVSINATDTNFNHFSRQISLDNATNATDIIYENAVKLLKASWHGEPLRLLGVSTKNATNEHFEQYDLFDQKKNERLNKLNSALDQIRDRYGNSSVKRASLIKKD